MTKAGIWAYKNYAIRLVKNTIRIARIVRQMRAIIQVELGWNGIIGSIRCNSIFLCQKRNRFPIRH